MQKVHLGCGTRRLLGYIHVDARDLPGIDYVATADKLPFENNSIDELYFCHGIEHIEQDKLDYVLGEFYRVLKYHGILRLAVPDFSAINYLYDKGVQLDRAVGLLMGRQDYPQNLHYNVFDFETQASILRKNRYFDIKSWSPDEIFPSDYHDYSYAEIYTKNNEKINVSLNVQAKKF